MNLTELHDELLVYIFTFLSGHLGPARGTCGRLKHIIDSFFENGKKTMFLTLTPTKSLLEYSNLEKYQKSLWVKTQWTERPQKTTQLH